MKCNDVCNGNGGRGENGDKDGNLCCVGGVKGDARCLLGLAGGVRNL